MIGRWQSAPCRLLLLDEPFQGVDVGARRDIVEAIRADRRDGATLIATSDVEEAIEAADVVAVMRGHSIVGLHDLRTTGGSSLVAAIAALETTSPTTDKESGGVTADVRHAEDSPRAHADCWKPSAARCAAMRSSSFSPR